MPAVSFHATNLPGREAIPQFGGHRTSSRHGKPRMGAAATGGTSGTWAHSINWAGHAAAAGRRHRRAGAVRGCALLREVQSVTGRRSAVCPQSAACGHSMTRPVNSTSSGLSDALRAGTARAPPEVPNRKWWPYATSLSDQTPSSLPEGSI